MVVVVVVGAAPIHDPVQLLQREMKEMKRNYEDMKQKLDSTSGSLISSYFYTAKLNSLPYLLKNKAVGLILSNRGHAKTKSSATR